MQSVTAYLASWVIGKRIRPPCETCNFKVLSSETSPLLLGPPSVSFRESVTVEYASEHHWARSLILGNAVLVLFHFFCHALLLELTRELYVCHTER